MAKKKAPQRLAGAEESCISPEQEAIIRWFRTVKFRKNLLGGVDETCPLTPGEEREEYCDYKVKKGEYWAGIVAAKYKREDGTGFNLDPKKRTKEENKELMGIVHYLKDKHGVKYSDNVQPPTMRLYSEINGKKYNVECDAKVKEKATKFPPAKRYTGKAADGTVRYFYTDCNGNRSQFFKTKEERDAAMQNAENAQKAA